MGNENKYLEFIVANQVYAFQIDRVKEAIQMVAISKIPQDSTTFIRGVINLRGNVVRVIDLRAVFGLELVEDTLDMNLLVVKMRFNPVSLIVDEVLDVVEILPSDIEASSLVGNTCKYISSIAKKNNKLIYILEIKNMFSAEEKLAIEQKQR